jgi:hypothetical protein
VNNKKAPGEDGITGEIFKQTFKTFPKYITAMYNVCLRKGVFPKMWKRAKLNPIVKPGKEESRSNKISTNKFFKHRGENYGEGTNN